MDNNFLTKILLSNPVWIVLSYLLQNPDLELNDAEISKRIKNAQKSAVNVSLNKLFKAGLIARTPRGRMKFNKLVDSPLVDHLKIISNLVYIQSLVDKIKPLSSKIILFGSRASGMHNSESDFDLFVVTSDSKGVIKLGKPEEKIQMVFKTPVQMLSIEKDDQNLYKEIKKGIVLWECEKRSMG